MGGHMFVGRVVSNRMQKTVVVAVDRVVWYPKQKLYVKRTSRHFAHDEEQACDIGDLVKIHATRRLSKHKHYAVGEVLRKVAVYTPAAGQAAAAAAEAAAPRSQVEVAEAEVSATRQRLQQLREMYRRELGEAGAGGSSAFGSSSGSAGASSSAAAPRSAGDGG